MKGKLRIIIPVAIAVVGFGVSYFVSPWLSKASVPITQPDSEETKDKTGLNAQVVSLASVQPVTVRMREKELVELIREVRLKIDACRRKQEELEKREKRMRIAGEILKKQAQELEVLRMQLVSPLTRVREAMAEMESTRLHIGTQEKANMKRVSAMCEKMNSASAGEMLSRMCKNNQEDDAVKILYYMSERSAGKLLSEVPDKELAARLCGKLKTIQEKD